MELNKAAITCAMALLFIVPLASAASVTRTLSPSTVSPGGTVTVTLTVDVAGSKEFYAIDDLYPQGWEVTDAGVGSIQHTGHWKHVIISDAVNTQYTYTLRAPTEEGTYSFAGGEYIFGGMEDTVQIAGQDTITVAPQQAGVEVLVIAVIIVIAVVAFLVMKKK